MKNHKIICSVITMAATLAISNVTVAKEVILNEELADKNGCMTCHSLEAQKVNNDSGEKLPIGPSFPDIAARFNNDNNISYEELVRTIKHGSSPYRSHWKGKITGLAMPPNKDTISDMDINKLLIWILSLDDPKS